MAEDQIIRLPHNWSPRDYQKPLWSYLRSKTPRKRAVFVCHRRGGKDLLSVNAITCAAMEEVGTYWHVFPEFKQAKAAIWNGITSEGGEGNEGVRGTRFLDHIPPEIIDRTYENELRIKFRNGSNYYLVGSDNYDGLMGTNPRGIVMSEYSLQDPSAWHYLLPILSENGGWALFVYTFRGKNHGWWLAQNAKKNGWFYDERHAGSGPNATRKPNGDPVVSDDEIDKLRKEGVPEAIIQQEFFNNCEAPIEGAYYAREMAAAKAEGRICDIQYEPRLPVYTAWDVGFDMGVVIFYQLYKQEIRIIDCYHKTEADLPHFAGIVKSRPYTVYEKHFAPWDVDTREWNGSKSTYEVAKELGIKFTVTPQKPGNATILDGIQQVKMILSKCIFNGSKCGMLLDALRGYRPEPAEEKLQFTGEGSQQMKMMKSTPLHSWESHFCDAVRILSWNYKERNESIKAARPPRAVDEYNYV